MPLRILRVHRSGFRRVGLGGTARLTAGSALLSVLWAMVVSREVRSEEARDAGPQETLTISRQALEGSGRSIHGLERVLLDPNGALQVAGEVFPEGSKAEGVSLPPALGGGYLFYQRFQRIGGVSTRLYRASSWTGALEAWGTLPVAVDAAVPGWDRIYFTARGRAFALKPGAARALPLEPFPNVPTVSELRFWGAEEAAIRSPLVGWLLTRDKGRSFQKGEPPAGEIERKGKPEPQSEPSRLFPMLAEAVRFAAGTKGRDFVLLTEEERVQGEVQGDAVVLRRTRRTDSLGSCSGEGELVLHWLCRSSTGAGGKTRLVREDQGRLVPLASAQGERATLAVSENSVLVSGLCSDPSKPGYCLLSERGARDLPLPRGTPLSFGLSGQEVVALFRDETSDDVSFRLVDLISHRARLARLSGTKPLGALARGTILTRLHFSDDFGFWATRGEEFVGFTFAEGGLRAGPIQAQLRRATFSGARALVWGAAGFGKETLDGGTTWSDLPLSAGEDDSRPPSRGELTRAGSSRIGTLLGDRVRLGWGAPPLRTAPEDLTEIPLPPLGGGRYHFTCRPVPRAPLRALEEPPSERAPLVGNEAMSLPLSVSGLGAQIVLSGTPGPRFGNESRVSIEYHDPFSIEPKRSKATRGLFGSRSEAEQALGLFDSTVSYATGFLRPPGTGGVVFVRTRDVLRLFAFEEGGPFYSLALPDGAPSAGLVGVARRHGSFYLAFSSDSRLEIFREQTGRLEPFASFPLEDPASRFVALIEDEQENLAVAIDGDTGLFVFPLSDQAELAWPPRVFPHQGYRPETCSEKTGFLIARDLPVSPQIEGPDGVLPVLSVRALLRAGDAGLCLEALSARARGPVVEPGTRIGASSAARSIPLSVFGSNGGPLGTLRCE